MDWGSVRNEWENSKITLAALAEKHGLKLGTLKSRKSREEWTRKTGDATEKKDATKSAKVATLNPVIGSSELKEKQQQFCLHYIRHFNATKAYQETYGCDYKTAHANSYRMMANEGVKKEIRRLKAEMQHELFLDAGDIAREYMKMAFADITDFVDFGVEHLDQMDDEGFPIRDPETGEVVTRPYSFVRLKDKDDVDGTMIQEVKLGRDGVSVKLYDKQKALQELNKRILSLDELKAQKLKAEINKLDNDDGDDGPIEIMISRKGGR